MLHISLKRLIFSTLLNLIHFQYSINPRFRVHIWASHHLNSILPHYQRTCISVDAWFWCSSLIAFDFGSHLSISLVFIFNSSSDFGSHLMLDFGVQIRFFLWFRLISLFIFTCFLTSSVNIWFWFTCFCKVYFDYTSTIKKNQPFLYLQLFPQYLVQQPMWNGGIIVKYHPNKHFLNNCATTQCYN